MEIASILSAVSSFASVAKEVGDVYESLNPGNQSKAVQTVANLADLGTSLLAQAKGEQDMLSETDEAKLVADLAQIQATADQLSKQVDAS